MDRDNVNPETPLGNRTARRDTINNEANYICLFNAGEVIRGSCEKKGKKDLRMSLIFISNYQIEELKELTHKRNDPKIGTVKNQRIDLKRGDLDINLQGLLGEYAVARFLEIDIDKSIDLSGDGGIYDLLYRGKKLQVKWTNYKQGMFYVKCMYNFRADIGVLTIPYEKLYNGLDVRIVGWITRAEFDRRKQKVNFGYNDLLGVKQVDMNHIEALKNI